MEKETEWQTKIQTEKYDDKEYIYVAVEVLGVSTRVGHRTCTRASLHVRHTRSLRGR